MPRKYMLTRVVYPNRIVGWAVSIAMMLSIFALGTIKIYAAAEELDVSAQTLLRATTLYSRLAPGESDVAAWKVYRNSTAKFGFRYPSEWSEIAIESGFGITNASFPATITVTLSRGALGDGDTLENFARNDLATSGARLLSLTEASVGGRDATHVILKSSSRYYVRSSNGSVVVFSASYPHDTGHLETIDHVFQKIISSVVFFS